MNWKFNLPANKINCPDQSTDIAVAWRSLCSVEYQELCLEKQVVGSFMKISEYDDMTIEIQFIFAI